ncbi:MAG: hypothetical protein ACREH3_02430 [Geminicoccales bacterium]
MSARAGLALVALALLGLAPLAAGAQERERRCYFGECPDESSPQPPPPEVDTRPDYPPPVDQSGEPYPGQDPGQYPAPYPDTAGDLPHFCCTVMGPLGPYPNPGPYGVAPVGSACSGMAGDGLFYQGTACYGDEQPAAATMPPAPSFCCTAAGRFGPFPNPGWPEGSACWSQTVYGPMQGLACY